MKAWRSGASSLDSGQLNQLSAMGLIEIVTTTSRQGDKEESIFFTKKAQPYVVPGNSGAQIIFAEVVKIDVVEIKKVSGSESIVTFTATYRPTPLGDVICKILQCQLERRGEITFKHTDKGWQPGEMK
jgi:hypothetical protein